MELFLEILLCVFAVFGLWCLFHLLIDAALGAREIGTVIVVARASAVRELPQLLDQARHWPFRRRGEHLIVLYDRSLCGERGVPPDAARAMIERAGGRWIVTDVRQDLKQT